VELTNKIQHRNRLATDDTALVAVPGIRWAKKSLFSLVGGGIRWGCVIGATQRIVKVQWERARGKRSRVERTGRELRLIEL